MSGPTRDEFVALARDYTVVLGITVLLALMIIVANLIVDIVQAHLDPRIREAPA